MHEGTEFPIATLIIVKIYLELQAKFKNYRTKL